MERIDVFLPKASFKSAPYRSQQRIHVKLDQMQKWRREYPMLGDLEEMEGNVFETLVSKSQWLTRYLITG